MYCIYKNCYKKLVHDSLFCMDHKCKKTSCKNDKKDNKLYCKDCKCLCCENIYPCKNHLCPYENCNEYNKYNCNNSEYSNACEEHECLVCPNVCRENYKGNCDENQKICLKHKCTVINCNKVVYDFTPKKSKKYKIISKFCKNHKCEEKDCKNKTYINRNNCIDHICPFKNCEKTKTYNSILCESHICENICCSDSNEFYILNSLNNHDKLNNINWKIAWIKICNYKTYSINFDPFINWFKKTSYVLFFSLKQNNKQNNIHKDIRKIIFYQHLKNTVNFYFSGKKCYLCLLKCYKGCKSYEIKDCPGKNCTLHFCDKKDCTKDKFKVFVGRFEVEKYNYCKDHKCQESITCKENPYKYVDNDNKLIEKQYCNKHLCPLCRTDKIFDQSFCQNCQCKLVTNEKRCKNPKHYINIDGYCIEHQDK